MTAPALGVVPPLPEGYTYENQRFIHQGIRINIAHKGYIIAEAEQRVKYVPEFDDPVGLRYVARATNGHDRLARPIEDPHPWVTYPDMETLVSAVLARHRIGVKQ
jgi:hypothetical protein